ncbi:peroxidasin homolog isoform X2 [Argopecten irradians]|uniref:peroxidasin homolog isoform X2 n=1 Tax=Argopecten irradians TaxID=31199 RepID=UPI0037101E85
MKSSPCWIYRIIKWSSILLVIPFAQGHHKRSWRQSSHTPKLRGLNYIRHHARPIFLSTQQNITVHLGQTAHLKCKIKYLGTKTVQWRKIPNNYPLTIGALPFSPREEISINHRAMDDMVSQWTLVIKGTSTADTGSYECKVSASETLPYIVHLNVLDKPVYIEKTIWLQGTEFVSVNQMINLTCNATGVDRAPEHIDWFHNGHIVHQSDPKWQNRLKIVMFQPEVPGRSLISQLIIEFSRSGDQGNYVCRSSEKKTTSLNVHVLNAEKDNIKKRFGTSIPDESPQENRENHAAHLTTNCVLLFLSALLAVR